MEYRYAVPKKRSHKALTVTLVVLAVILAAAAVLLWMVLNDPNAGKGLENTKPTDTLIKTVVKSAGTGKEAEFNVQDTNGFIADEYQKHNVKNRGGSLKIQGVAVLDASGSSADVYLPVLYQGRHFGIVLNLTPSLDTKNNQLDFKVNSVKVGRLTVPTNWALDLVKEHLSEGFFICGDTISCASPSVEASYSGITGSVKVSQLKIENGLLKVGTKMEVSVSLK